MEKADLKAAAEALATCEVLLRQTYRQLVQSEGERPAGGGETARESVLLAQLKELRQKRVFLKEQADRIRAGIPKLAGKRYWWDIPFDETKPLLAGEYAPENIYSEQEPWEEVVSGGRLRLARKEMCLPGGCLLQYMGSWIPLYLNKKEMAAHLSDEMELRCVYRASARVMRARVGHSLSAFYGEGSEEAEDAASMRRGRMDEIDRELERKLERHNNFWDFMERWDHGSFYTNEQRWRMGLMETGDYLSENAGRMVRQAELEFKAFEQKANLEYQARQEKNRRLAESYRRMRSRAVYADSNVIRVTRAAQTAYYRDRLMAVYLPAQEEGVYEINAGREVNPLRLEGEIYGIKEIGAGHPDDLPLFFFLVGNYEEAMGPCNVLSVQPKGLSDEKWRAFMELRWGHGLRRA